MHGCLLAGRYYELEETGRGPGGGFVYKRKQNKKGEEVGGLVPHITLKSIANNEEPKMEVLVDRSEEVKCITRVAGPVTVEATIPAAAETEALDEQVGDRADFPSPQSPVPLGAHPLGETWLRISSGCWRCCAVPNLQSR